MIVAVTFTLLQFNLAAAWEGLSDSVYDDSDEIGETTANPDIETTDHVDTDESEIIDNSSTEETDETAEDSNTEAAGPMNMEIMPLLAAPDLVTQINMAYGLLSAYSPGLTASFSPTDINVINVTGTVTDLKASCNLNIDPNVTVNWDANFSGTLNGAYIINLTGAGTFNLNSDGLISNTGTSGAVNVIGAGATITINGGALSSDTNGTTLNIASNGITANIISGGMVANAGTTSSAVSVVANVTDVKINIDGGRVSSTPGGYAINDGGANKCGNNTEINITGGSTVESGSACAVQSTGSGTVVTVTDSTVTNSAGSNTNSTIYMNGGTGDNVIINGSSTIQTTNPSNTSYVIQTTGNVLVEDNAQVIAIAGRAISLVGMDSTATITGGKVYSNTGIAITTATTTAATVQNAKVVVTGGWVYTNSGAEAIQTTGSNGSVEVSGGWVTATTGLAVKSASAVYISGGFVFAYGAGIGNVVTAPNSNFAGDGVIAAWTNPSLNHTYIQGTADDLVISPADSAHWHNSGTTGGIYYEKNSNIGFFPLADVTVELTDMNVQGLIFDIDSGKFYLGAININSVYNSQPGEWTWDGATGILTLNEFNWATSAPVALTITGGTDINIELVNVNTFVSTGSGINAAGIDSHTANITITGAGTLNASASSGIGINCSGCSLSINSGTVNAAAGGGINCYGITAAVLTISEGDGTLTASGNSRAVNNTSFYLPGGYAYCTGAKTDGSDAGSFNVPGDASYFYNANNCYVKIQARKRHVLTVKGAVAGDYFAGETIEITADAPALGPFTPIGKPYYSYPNEQTAFKLWSGGDGGTFTNINSAATAFKMPDNDANIDVITQTAYRLRVEGGFISWEQNANYQDGYYLADAEIPVRTHSSPVAGYIFKGWTVVIGGGNTLIENPGSIYAVFTMPAQTAQVEAPWVPDNLPDNQYVLTVENGRGNLTNGSLNAVKAGTWANISADAPLPGQEFDCWKITSSDAVAPAYPGMFLHVNDADTQFIMAEGDITITATYRDIDYVLIVEHGTGSGVYTTGTSIGIEADQPPTGQLFDKWVTNSGGAFANDSDTTTTYAMPAENATVTAVYKDIPSGDGGNYIPPSGGGIIDNHVPPATDITSESDDSAQIIPTKEDKEESDVSAFPNAEKHIAYVQGIGNNLFAPDKNMTRAETAQMIYNLLLDKNVETTNRFTDVPDNEWYAKLVNALASLGIVEGFQDDCFYPNANITRAEFAAIIVRFTNAVYDNKNIVRFNDVLATHWAFSYINAATYYGWIKGYGNGLFKPDCNISRAEAVTVMNRVIKRSPDKSYIDSHPELVRFSDVHETYWAYYDIMEAYCSHDYIIHNNSEEWQ